ncbi:MAG TPA: hypothetical protein VEL82_01770 [Thermoplasmata archaeon]|nr:hypothetical protein [Thermoplasmata archaeon]
MGLATIAGIACLVLASGLASAAGSGYNLTFSQSATTNVADVALTALSTSYSGGPNLTATMTVAGTFQMNNQNYEYAFFFGGTSTSSSAAYATFSNNSTFGYYESTTGSGGGSFGTIVYGLSNGGSSLSISLNITLVGPSSGFTANAWALYGTQSSGAVSYIGSAYTNSGGGSGGGVTCTGTSCTTSAGTPAPFDWWIVIVPIVVVIAVVAVVLVLLMRRRKPAAAPAPGMMPPPPGMMPPPPPPTGGSVPPPPPGAA